MNIAEFLQPENVILGLVTASKLQLLQIVSEKAAVATGVESKKIFGALDNREKLGSTGVGEGIAIPHAPIGEITIPFGMLIRLKKPIDFESIDGIPVDIVFLLLTPLESRSAHLNVLACIARRLRSPDILKEIRSAPHSGRLHALFVDGPA
jgi:PTS system nitrogen regulatory IIA component